MGPLAKFCLATIVYFLMLANAAAVEHKRVMVLHSVGREFKPWSEYAKDIRAELERQSPWPLDVQDYSLVAARSADQSPEVPFVEYLRTLYGDHPPDLIIVIGAPAASFIQRHRKDLFATVPMLFTAVEQRRVRTSELTEYDTVVAVIIDVRLLVESFLRIAPDTKTIAIINGDSPNERFWKGDIRRELQSLKDRIELRWYDKLSYEDLLKQTAALPPHSAIFWSQMMVDGAGVAHDGDRALTRLYQTANAPIFSHDDAFFTGEIVGGPMNSALASSRKAAEVAIRILGGEKPGDIKTPASHFAAPKYDWRQLQRWNISERFLPPGAEVDFREQSLWGSYHWQILFVCTVVLAQATLIALLLHEHRRRSSAEVQSLQRLSELAHVNRFSTTGELTASITHEITQPLGAIHTNAETLELMLKSSACDLSEIRAIVADIRRDDARAGKVIHRLRSLLRKTPFEPKDADLNDIVREAVDFLSALADARQLEMRASITAVPLPIRGDRVQLQQVILNVVLNAMDAMANMPMAARRITISTAHIDNVAEVAITDTGPGITAEKIKEVFEPFFTTKPNGMGMGLSIARTIIEAHDGQILAENLPAGGVSIRFELPLVLLRHWHARLNGGPERSCQPALRRTRSWP